MSSVYQFLGWPTEVGVVLFSVGLLLALAPWLGGISLGGFEVPKLPPKAGQTLKVVGPLALLLAAGGFFPWIAADKVTRAPTPPAVVAGSEQDLRQRCRGGEAGACRELAELYRNDLNAAKAALLDNPRDVAANVRALDIANLGQYIINRAEILERIEKLQQQGLPHVQEDEQLSRLDRSVWEGQRYRL
jgi:hypothetical protein